MYTLIFDEMDYLGWQSITIPSWAAPSQPRNSHPAKRHRSTKADLHTIEEQRQMATLQRGPLRTATFPTSTTPLSMKVPPTSLIVPYYKSWTLKPQIIAFCRDRAILGKFLEWTRGGHSVILLLCQNDCDQMTLKLAFPDLY